MSLFPLIEPKLSTHGVREAHQWWIRFAAVVLAVAAAPPEPVRGGAKASRQSGASRTSRRGHRASLNAGAEGRRRVDRRLLGRRRGSARQSRAHQNARAPASRAVTAALVLTGSGAQGLVRLVRRGRRRIRRRMS